MCSVPGLGTAPYGSRTTAIQLGSAYTTAYQQRCLLRWGPAWWVAPCVPRFGASAGQTGGLDRTDCIIWTA